MSVATEREKKMAEMLDASIPRMMRSLSAMAPPRLPPCSQVPDEIEIEEQLEAGVDDSGEIEKAEKALTRSPEVCHLCHH